MSTEGKAFGNPPDLPAERGGVRGADLRAAGIEGCKLFCPRRRVHWPERGLYGGVLEMARVALGDGRWTRPGGGSPAFRAVRTGTFAPVETMRKRQRRAKIGQYLPFVGTS